MRKLVLLAVSLILLSLAGGCSSASTPTVKATSSSSAVASTTSAPASSTPAAKPATSAPGGGQTFGQLSTAGKSLFSSRCARCHGDNGQGVTAPAIIGSKASLNKYSTGQGLLGYISSAMPFGAPGSLSHQDYLNLLAYLLVQNNYVTDNTAFNEGQLGIVALK